MSRPLLATLAVAASLTLAACADTGTTGPTPVPGGPRFITGPIYDAAAAPNGTHLQSGTPSCSVTGTAITCSTYELAGVGNANAQATLDAAFAAVVQCRNHGGQIVEVKSQAESAPISTGQLQPKNGRLPVPALSTGNVPTASDFTSQATCPNGNWTKVLKDGTVTLTSFTYTLTFAGFSSAYITITGP
jgi:hypothetical protein